MERKVGEVFEYNGVKLRVARETYMHNCDGCFFRFNLQCKLSAQKRGECLSDSRSDGGVIFVKVNEMEERTIKLSLEKAREYFNKGGELREIALQAYSEDEMFKHELPKTWEEYKKLIHKEDIDAYNEIAIWFTSDTCRSYYKLRCLRDYYRQGWKPDWSDSEQTKYCIIENDGLEVEECYQNRQFLAFQTRELAEQLLDNFRDIIIKADIL